LETIFVPGGNGEGTCVCKVSRVRSVVDDVVYDYLKCGDLKEGFARVQCTNPDCRKEYFLAFSCKGRWFCPGCHSKKVIKFGEDVCNNILYPVPHRQFVFSIPILLRVYFKYDRKLLTEFCQPQTWAGQKHGRGQGN
jgi:hypothetical protein